MSKYFYGSVFFALIIVAAAIHFLYMQNHSFHRMDLHVVNVLMALLSVLSYRIITAALKSNDTQRVMQAKMLSLMLKFFVGILILLGYIFYHNRVIENKANLFVLLGIYVLYTAIETGFLAAKARSK